MKPTISGMGGGGDNVAQSFFFLGDLEMLHSVTKPLIQMDQGQF